MAINRGTETLAIQTEERTWRITIESAKGVDPTVTVFRETIRTGPDGAIISQAQVPDGTVTRSLSATAKQSFKIGDRTYTMAEIAGVIAAIADVWRQEDIDSATKGEDQ